MAALDPTKLLDWLKLSPRYLFVLSMVLGILLFGPKPFLYELGVQHFVDEFRMYIGIGFLLFSLLFLASAIQIIYTFFKDRAYSRGQRKMQLDRLNNLTKEEKEILHYYIANQTRTQSLPYDNGLVNELEKFKIIYRAANISQGYEIFAYNIQPWAWNYLNNKAYLLEVDTDEGTENQIS